MKMLLDLLWMLHVLMRSLLVGGNLNSSFLNLTIHRTFKYTFQYPTLSLPYSLISSGKYHNYIDLLCCFYYSLGSNPLSSVFPHILTLLIIFISSYPYHIYLPSGKDGAHRVTQSFMQRNAFYSKRNFGNQADNATGNHLVPNLTLIYDI